PLAPLLPFLHRLLGWPGAVAHPPGLLRRVREDLRAGVARLARALPRVRGRGGAGALRVPRGGRLPRPPRLRPALLPRPPRSPADRLARMVPEPADPPAADVL